MHPVEPITRGRRWPTLLHRREPVCPTRDRVLDAL